MKKKLIIALGAVVVVAVIVGVLVYNSTRVTAEYSNDYTKTFGEFTAKTASTLLREKKENTCYSPASLFGNLTLSAEITEGDTQKEIINFLGVNDITSLEEYYTKLLGSIEVDNTNSKIMLSNSLWTKRENVTDVAIDKFKELEEKLNCSIFIEEEINESEVNQWISENTNGLIKDMSIGNNKNFVLVNNLYYYSKWRADVGKKKEEQEFFTEEEETLMVPYLSVYKKRLSYKEEKDYTYVIVPLKEGEMVFVLPAPERKLDYLLSEKKLNDIIASITGENEEGLVKLEMPKFKIEQSISNNEVKSLLEKNNVDNLCTNASWIDGIEGGVVSLMQKTRIKVDEEGVEAVASTVLYGSIGIKDDPKAELEITFNRPFLYILMKDGVPLFIGTVYNPAE